MALYINILSVQNTLRPFLIDPSSRATEWLKVHLKDKRLEVINQQAINCLIDKLIDWLSVQLIYLISYLIG